MNVYHLPKFAVAIAALALALPTVSVRADDHRDGKAANALGDELAELNQNAESAALQAEKAREVSAAELASAQKVLNEARKILISAEKAEADAVARLMTAEANMRGVEAVRNAIHQANETAKKHLTPKSKSAAKEPEAKPQPKAKSAAREPEAKPQPKAQTQKPKPAAEKATPAAVKPKAEATPKQ